jgi:XTP/dITP diphosphohydrolase
MIPARIVLATSNAGKVRELRALVGEWGRVEVLSLADFPGVESPDETGASYVENALLKARAVATATGVAALADDSGLEVDALGGAPGVLSARWAPTNEERIAKLLAALDGVADGARGACFRCAVALALPDGTAEVGEGEVVGSIVRRPRGAGGFGYDPIFVPVELGERTFAEASAAEKRVLSHRARAMRALGAILSRATLRPPARPC